MMERSSRFISLSGKSGIAAGICGLISAFIAHKIIGGYYSVFENRGWSASNFTELASKLFILGIVTMAFAFLLGFYFTWQKAKNGGTPIWNSSSKRLLVNVCIPLAAGGVFIVGMLANNEWLFIGPTCLIFYGLALLNGSKYTIDDIRYLGLLEILLGSINLFCIRYTLLFWAIGFGLLHIIYGIIMWNKYDKKENSIG